MADQKMIRLSQAARKLNVGITTLAEELVKQGFKVDAKPNTKITTEQYDMLEREFAESIAAKQEASSLSIGGSLPTPEPTAKKEPVEPKEEPSNEKVEEPQAPEKTETSSTAEDKAPEEEPPTISAKLPGLKVVDKIDLDQGKKKKKPESETPKEVEEVSSVLESVKSSDFYSPTNQTIFEAMKDLFDSGKPIDSVTVSETVFKDNKNTTSLKTSSIARLIENVPSSANFERYIEIVLEHSNRRCLSVSGVVLHIRHSSLSITFSNFKQEIIIADMNLLVIGKFRTW